MKPRRASGFTLVELAVAMVIIGLLLAAAMIPLAGQIEIRDVASTQATMDEIKDAIIGFVQANGRLPCPAIPTTAAGSTDATTNEPAGVEDTNPYPVPTSAPLQFVCRRSFGVVPWTTLGVPERDVWGRRFGYRVSAAYADALPGSGVTDTWATATTTSPASSGNQNSTVTCNPPTNPAMPVPTLASFALCTLGDIAVFNPTPQSKAPAAAIATGIPAIIISYGKNGIGGYQSSGIAVSGSPATHEAANRLGTTQSTPTGSYASWTFYTRERSPQASSCSDTAAGSPFCEFDDLLTWISPSTLTSRMVSAGRLP